MVGRELSGDGQRAAEGLLPVCLSSVVAAVGMHGTTILIQYNAVWT